MSLESNNQFLQDYLRQLRILQNEMYRYNIDASSVIQLQQDLEQLSNFPYDNENTGGL